MRKLIAVLLAALVLGLAGCATTGAGESGGKQKVVYHVNYDDPKQQSAAMRNIQNHINAVGAENLDLRVVMHGKGVSLLATANEDMDFQSKVVSLKSQGIAFNVCANTLKGRKLDYKTQLFDVTEADIVPSGVAELARLQNMGYAYIKP
jgi:intracellular sulfur oxidation DsrE/DsrF family protein